MRHRRFLAALGSAALAGCADRTGSPSTGRRHDDQPTPSENVHLDDRERAAQLNPYDFSGWEPTVEVTITHRDSGDVALENAYDLSLPLSIQPT